MLKRISAVSLSLLGYVALLIGFVGLGLFVNGLATAPSESLTAAFGALAVLAFGTSFTSFWQRSRRGPAADEVESTDAFTAGETYERINEYMRTYRRQGKAQLAAAR